MSKLNNAKAILKSCDARALAAIVATERILGPQFLAWEPETIRVELADEGVEITSANFDALMAAITLRVTTNFYWDANTFENVIVALNAHNVVFDTLQEVTPAQIAWGVTQAHLIVDKLSNHDIPKKLSRDDRFDYEPVCFAVAACMHAGMSVAPKELSFCRELLDKRTQSDREFVSQIKKAWRKMDKTKLSAYTFKDTPVDIQLSKMATVVLYVQAENKELEKQLALL